MCWSWIDKHINRKTGIGGWERSRRVRDFCNCFGSIRLWCVNGSSGYKSSINDNWHRQPQYFRRLTNWFSTPPCLVRFISGRVIKFNQLSLAIYFHECFVFVFRQQRNLIWSCLLLESPRSPSTKLANEQFNHVIIVTLKKYKITIS